jgi:hypothetical protein
MLLPEKFSLTDWRAKSAFTGRLPRAFGRRVLFADRDAVRHKIRTNFSDGPDNAVQILLSALGGEHSVLSMKRRGHGGK